jgi:hypothetical protein
MTAAKIANAWFGRLINAFPMVRASVSMRLAFIARPRWNRRQIAQCAVAWSHAGATAVDLSARFNQRLGDGIHRLVRAPLLTLRNMLAFYPYRSVSKLRPTAAWLIVRWLFCSVCGSAR